MPDSKSDTTTSLAVPAHKVEIARRAFGDALSTRVNMRTYIGDISVQVIREAIAIALEAVKDV